MKLLSQLKPLDYNCLALCVVLLGYAAYQSSNIVDIEKHPSKGYDERMWTGASIKTYQIWAKDYKSPNLQIDQGWFTNYAIEHDLDINDFSVEQLQYFDQSMWTFGWKAPNVGKLIMGKWIHTFHKEEIDPNGYFYFDQEKNRIDNQSSQELIHLARIPNSIMGIGVILLTMIIAWRFFHPLVAVVAGAYLALNEIFIKSVSLAMLEASSIFFSTATLLAAFVFIEMLYRKKPLKWLLPVAFGTGVLFALAVGSKLNAALIGFIAMALFGLLAISLMSGKVSFAKNAVVKKEKKKKANTKKSPLNSSLLILGLSGLVLAIGTYMTFTWTNPIFKTEPVKVASVIRESVDDFFDIRAKSLKTDHIKASWVESAKLTTKRNFVLTQDRFSEKAGKYVYFGTFGRLLPFKYNPLDGVLIIGGLVILLLLGVKHYRTSRLVQPTLILGVFTAILLYGNIDFIWIDWTRYFMGMYPAFAICVGYSIIWIASRFKKDLGMENRFSNS